MDSNNTETKIDVSAEKISLGAALSNPEAIPTSVRILQEITPLPESIKLNPTSDSNIFTNQTYDYKIENVLPESIKVDISSINDYNNLTPSIKNDVNQYNESNPLISPTKIEYGKEDPKFENTVIEVSKKEIGVTGTPISKFSNTNDLNTLKVNMNNMMDNIGSALRGIEEKINMPQQTDNFQERITLNPTNLIFYDRKISSVKKPHWS